MGYKVTGAAAVVEMDDGEAELGTGRRLYLEEMQMVPEGAKKASVEHLVKVGLVEEVKAAAASGSEKQKQGS